MNDGVHNEQVAKQDANSLHAFTSGSAGHIADCWGQVHIAYRRSPRRPRCRRRPMTRCGSIWWLGLPTTQRAGRGVTTNPRGIVIAAMGAGHVPVAMAEAAGPRSPYRWSSRPAPVVARPRNRPTATPALKWIYCAVG